MHLRRNTMCSVYNSVFAGFPEGLHIDGNNTQANADANNLQIENTFISGCQNASKFFTVPSGQTWTSAYEAGWFLNPTRNNDTLINNSQLQLIDPFNLTAPNFLPTKTVYKLNGWIYVKNNATLTIDPGTIIRGDKTAQGALIIERGSKLNAIGTQAEPIVFTSGEPALSRTYGDWGGVIMCGYAQCNLPGGTGTIEGGVGSTYGGGLTPNNADNSGTLKYVRIEFGGIAFAANNEINGLTMGGIGNGTTIDNVQVSYNGDDAFEWFGGTVNAKHLIAFRNWDDEFDTDNGYQGKVQFAVSLRDPNVADSYSGSNGFESDNDGTGTTNQPYTSPTFSNVSMFGPQPTPGAACDVNYKRALHLRRNTAIDIYNAIFLGYPTGLYVDGNNTQNKATFDSLTLQYSFLAGMPATTFFGVPSGQTWNVSTERAWYTASARHNDTLVTSAAVQITDPFNLTTPNFLPLATSPVWGKSYWSRSVTGQITYDNAANTPMSNTTVYLKTQGGALVESTTTNATGNFTIFTIDGVYVLDGTTAKTYGGLDQVDAVRIRQNVSNLYAFSPLQYKAANVDLTTGPNNGVNVVDAVQIRQKNANIPTPNWKIANYVFETPTVTVSGANVVQNFKSLCAGDVNKNWTPPVE
jgi:ligand-binding SRPBCC domain-containing protein